MLPFLEYAFLRALLAALAVLPRGAARACGVFLARLVYRALPRLRRTGERNLGLAFPEAGQPWRDAVLRSAYGHLGRQLAEFAHMPRYTLANTADHIRYQDLHHWQHAAEKGKGVLILTGHLGCWELSSFYHSLAGHPMAMVIRRLDNPWIDRWVNRIRCLHGNTVLGKDEFARALLATVRGGASVGILMDTNMTPPQGVFVPFFGQLAATASGLARVARHTGAAVVPGCLLWHADERKYVLHFWPELPMARTADPEHDALVNTAACTAALEAIIRAYPDQWLWLHRRWKTRPPGEPSLY